MRSGIFEVVAVGAQQVVGKECTEARVDVPLAAYASCAGPKGKKSERRKKTKRTKIIYPLFVIGPVIAITSTAAPPWYVTPEPARL